MTPSNTYLTVSLTHPEKVTSENLAELYRDWMNNYLSVGGDGFTAFQPIVIIPKDAAKGRGQVGGTGHQAKSRQISVPGGGGQHCGGAHAASGQHDFSGYIPAAIINDRIDFRHLLRQAAVRGEPEAEQRHILLLQGRGQFRAAAAVGGPAKAMAKNHYRPARTAWRRMELGVELSDPGRDLQSLHRHHLHDKKTGRPDWDGLCVQRMD